MTVNKAVDTQNQQHMGVPEGAKWSESLIAAGHQTSALIETWGPC